MENHIQKKPGWIFLFWLLFATTLMQAAYAAATTKPVIPPTQVDNAATIAKPTTPSNDDDIKRLKVFVDSGIAYIKQYGEKKAYDEFNNPKGKFRQGGLYFFVYDDKGNCLAHGSTISRVGKNFYTELDKYGTPVIRLIIELAKAQPQGGFFSYYWPDPDTRNVQIKTSYIKAINDHVSIGSGVYKAIDMPQSQISIKLEEVKAFINEGIEYYREHGAQAAYKEFSNPNGAFRRGNMYLFVMNYKGIMIADGADPKENGEDFYNTVDEFGTPFVQLFTQIAKEGGGSVSYYWPEPSSKKTKLKVSYVTPLDKDTFIGSGFYGD
ncbi:MAG: hypothetical protein ACD_21C00293G0006 [uncultured bacterium]|nr:MAG: hypothetical protein ACD_21C00293G0006 [uncultured bacterium]